MHTSSIHIEGARVHNLKDISLEIPRGRLVVITGPSGCGKSSLAFDTVFAEGQRQYIESLSVYARQFLNQLPRPDVDRIRGLQPTVAVDQRGRSAGQRGNPRSTVATLCEIHDFLRVLYARCGLAHCHQCGQPIRQQSPERILESVLNLGVNMRLMLLAPVVRGRKGAHADVFRKIARAGFVRARVDGRLLDVEQPPELDPDRPHEIEAVIDRIVLKDGIRGRLSESLQLALKQGEGTVIVSYEKKHDEKEHVTDSDDAMPRVWHDVPFSTRYACPKCDISYVELEPRTFSFNSPYGVCPRCEGTGKVENKEQEAESRGHGKTIEKPFQKACLTENADEDVCPDCHGARLCPEARSVTFGGKRIHEVCALTAEDALRFFQDVIAIPPSLRERVRDGGLREDTTSPHPDLFPEERGVSSDVSTPLLEEIIPRLEFLNKIGLDYMTLDRPTDTLSGGELQRVRLAHALGGGLVGVCYVLDEPSIGLHPRDNKRLIDALRQLQKRGNTVLVVEHDEAIMRAADRIIDIGPGAGVRGGEIVGVCEVEDGELKIESRVQESGVKEQEPGKACNNSPRPFGERVRVRGGMPHHPTLASSLTFQYLTGQEQIPVPKIRRPFKANHVLTLENAATNNLKNVTVSFPLGTLICVTGVSGSGKSSLVNDTLVPLLRKRLGTLENSSNGPRSASTVLPTLHGADQIDKLIEVDQTPLGRSTRSNAATYTGVFDEIRKIFAATKDAKRLGYRASRFSFNAAGGRCETCLGHGVRKIDMHFLDDLYAVCPACNGRRFNRQTLEIKFKGKSIADVLDMPIDESAKLFESIPRIDRVLQSLRRVGLGYLALGQASSTLSGGETQRVKLAAELARPDTGNTLYVFDEPTSGLHTHDVRQLLGVLQTLVDHGNTVIVIEHHLDVMKAADWIIDLGPAGGSRGGFITAVGTPEQVAAMAGNVTDDNATAEFLRWSLLGR